MLDTILDNNKKVYGSRMTACLRELARLPPGWTVQDPKGGYFLWVQAPTDLTSFCLHLKSRGVAVLHGIRASSSFYLDKGEGGVVPFSSCFRLSIAHYEQDQLVEACKTIVTEASTFFQ